MSIPLKNSPFQGSYLPCKLCAESEDKIICTESGQPCSEVRNCRFYSPVEKKDYRNNLARSLKPRWIQKTIDTYYVEECSRCGGRVPRNQWNNMWYSKYCPSCGHRLYQLDEDVETVEPGIYQHFKGRQYLVLGTAQHTETSETFVVYRALYGKYVIYTRPLNMFAEDIEDLKNHYRGPRFFKIDDED